MTVGAAASSCMGNVSPRDSRGPSGGAAGAAALVVLVTLLTSACGDGSRTASGDAVGVANGKGSNVGSTPSDPVTADPVTVDPAAPDSDFPAALVDVEIPSGGERLNGILYRAQGPGPHPTVVLLHGLPGFERNLDLAQAVRRAGWNVLFFHYRGAWGSGGTFRLEHLREDALAALAQLREPVFAAQHRVDPARLALMGHSAGGWTTMLVGMQEESPRCLVSLAGAHAIAVPGPEDAEAQRQAAAALDGWTSPLFGTSGDLLVAEFAEHTSEWNVVQRASTYGQVDRRVLLVAGRRDVDTPMEQHHEPLFEALTGLGMEVEEAVFDSDHSFSDRRIALARRVVRFLDGCR